MADLQWADRRPLNYFANYWISAFNEFSRWKIAPSATTKGRVLKPPHLSAEHSEGVLTRYALAASKSVVLIRRQAHESDLQCWLHLYQSFCTVTRTSTTSLWFSFESLHSLALPKMSELLQHIHLPMNRENDSFETVSYHPQTIAIRAIAPELKTNDRIEPLTPRIRGAAADCRWIYQWMIARKHITADTVKAHVLTCFGNFALRIAHKRQFEHSLWSDWLNNRSNKNTSNKYFKEINHAIP